MADRLDKGYFGEQGAGFFLGAEGYYFVEGPGGSAGHAANAPGFDGVAFNPQTGDLIIFDNKAYKSSGNVASGTAIDPLRNLGTNLDGLITRVEGMSDVPDQKVILDRLRATRATLVNGTVAPPSKVRIAITNFGGNSANVSGPMQTRGITFIDMARQAPKIPAKDRYIDRNIVVTRAMGAPVVDSGMAGRMAKGEAIAMAVAGASQFLNDWALGHAIERETKSMAGAILRAQSQGLGVLLIYTIPAIRMEMVTSRSLSYADMVEGKTMREAYMRWWGTPRLEQGYGAHVTVERQFRWIPPF